MDERFIRERMLLGDDAMEILAHSHVAVFGIGGVGSYAAEGLARSGIGALTLVDDDCFSLSNLNRQLGALSSTIGLPKAETARNRTVDINPDIKARALVLRYDRTNRDAFFDCRYDYIIDAIDTVSCKLDLIVTAKERGIPIISALGTGNKLDPSKFVVCDISETKYCPFARVMRKELRRLGVSRHRVLYSSEPALRPQNLGEIPPPGRRSIPGSVAWVPSCAGLMLAGEVVLALSGRSTS